jgi:hypothetical protein
MAGWFFPGEIERNPINRDARMITFHVISPRIFNQAALDDPEYGFNLRQFLLKIIDSNAMLLIWPDPHSFIAECNAEIDTLNVKFRSRLRELVTSMKIKAKSKPQRVFVECDPTKCRITDKSLSAWKKCVRITEECKPDLIFLSEEDNADRMGTREIMAETDRRLGKMLNYLDSAPEKRRRHYMEGLGPVDKLAKGGFDDLIIRATRFSKWLRFFDAFLGNVDKFRLDLWIDGIGKIVELWTRNSHFKEDRVDIYTKMPPNVGTSQIKVQMRSEAISNT